MTSAPPIERHRGCPVVRTIPVRAPARAALVMLCALLPCASRDTGPILIDGLLDETDWGRAAPLTGFTQRLPAEGRPATQPTEVRILYDDENLYIGAELRDAEPGQI